MSENGNGNRLVDLLIDTLKVGIILLVMFALVGATMKLKFPIA